jgi:type IV pilus assembly protein PilA
MKKKLKDQRGLTLIELLAVVVILGIIAAIAVPSIGGLIDNTKKDAHVANAQVMVNAAKLAITTDANLQGTGTSYLTLNYLENQKFVDVIKDPDGTATSYAKGADTTNKDPQSTLTEADDISYVKITGGKVVSVKLVSTTGKRGVQVKTSKLPVPVDSLVRGSVNETP